MKHGAAIIKRFLFCFVLFCCMERRGRGRGDGVGEVERGVCC